MRPGNAGGAQTIVSAFLASFVCNSVGRRASPPIEPVGSSRGVPADSRILSPQGPKAPLAPWRGFAFLGMQGISREACDVTREPLARSHTPTRSPRDRCRPLVVGYYRRAPRICYGNSLHRDGVRRPTCRLLSVGHSVAAGAARRALWIHRAGNAMDRAMDGEEGRAAGEWIQTLHSSPCLDGRLLSRMRQSRLTAFGQKRTAPQGPTGPPNELSNRIE